MTIRETPVLQISTGVEPWRDRARCLGMDPNIFHPETAYAGRAGSSSLYDEARRVCRGEPHDGCPVRKQCLEFALGTQQMAGMWGGFMPAEREAMLRVREVRRALRELEDAG